jgi:hypothetical protein
MLFSESRYDFQGACGPIFGIKSTLPPNPKLRVPIIPNIGPRLASGPMIRIADFRKKHDRLSNWTSFHRRASSLFVQIDLVTYFWDTILVKTA